ncbi:hypothetical protein [Bacillus sp. N1-1]|uniref:hypothetical protein n=1 Tax=Bacillus sp. N1-1 TaxID=2682541 RepID=UPI001318BA0D|nr:hypothetical protein [Bacillus sp. N1-1]QHA90165.1 hypothetical protein GNK04_01045 [Bacillus sp. N1-1]
MSNIFFPDDETELGKVMRIFEQEFEVRNNWIREASINFNQALSVKPSFNAFNHAISIINHAMVLVRIIDLDAIGSRDVLRSKERAKILHERNPRMLPPPETLRNIRNDFEHLEERMDRWATSTYEKQYIDLAIGNGYLLRGSEMDTFRKLEGTKLKFWNNEVDLQEVIDWVEETNRIIIDNNNKRF